MKRIVCLLVLIAMAMPLFAREKSKKMPMEALRWSEERVNEWYAKQAWMSGCNFVPSNAINQLEMWQEDTFSPELIDKELGWAEELGFNVMRVYLHSKAWEADKQGFKKRIDEYLTISMKHGIRTMFVFFDDCNYPEGAIGKQPEPIPGMHNSYWLHDPFASLRDDKEKMLADLKPYVMDILKTLKDDERIVMWDLYNEPKKRDSIELLKKVFEWAREVNPSQPLTSAVWSLGNYPYLCSVQLNNSDVICYHSYESLESHKHWVSHLGMLNRPIMCTEYMARTNGCTFQQVMPFLREKNVGAINWGFVWGKSNTIYDWSTKQKPYVGGEPKVWFHDILRQDKTPFSEDEIRVIKECNKR